MPNYNVYIQRSLNVLGTTRDVLVPNPQNPVSANTEQDAVAIVAKALAETYGDDAAIGKYVIPPAGAGTVVSVVSFNKVPVFG